MESNIWESARDITSFCIANKSVDDIKSFLNIEIEIFGFTLKSGLPKYKENKFDRLYRWSSGNYKFDKKDNFNKLKSSKIYFGDIKNTLAIDAPV